MYYFILFFMVVKMSQILTLSLLTFKPRGLSGSWNLIWKMNLVNRHIYVCFYENYPFYDYLC